MYTKSNDSSLMLPSEKNLHAAVPPALLARIEQAADSARVTLDEFVTEAMERRLSRSWLDDVAAYGKRHARERGLKPSDVEKAIAEVRAEDPKRGR